MAFGIRKDSGTFEKRAPVASYLQSYPVPLTTSSRAKLDLPQVALFLILNLFISLERIQATKLRGRARAT